MSKLQTATMTVGDFVGPIGEAPVFGALIEAGAWATPWWLVGVAGAFGLGVSTALEQGFESATGGQRPVEYLFKWSAWGLTMDTEPPFTRRG